MIEHSMQEYYLHECLGLEERDFSQTIERALARHLDCRFTASCISAHYTSHCMSYSASIY
jgi:hypothetical protein